MAAGGASDFIAYRGPRTIHDSKVTSVSRQHSDALVELETIEGKRIGLRFTGVETMSAVDPVGMLVYSLSELRPPPNSRSRRFAFTSGEENVKDFEIMAASFHEE